MKEATPENRTELIKKIRQAREARGLTIEQVAKITYIPERFLRNLEEGHWDLFPSRTHLRGFLKKYCEFLGIPQELVLEGLPEIHEPEVGGAEKDEKQILEPGRKNFSWLILLAVVIAFCLLAASVMLLVRKHTSIEESTVEPASRTTIPTAASPSDATREFSFTLKALEDVWVRIESSAGRTELLLRPGDVHQVTGKGISMRIGNAGGLVIVKDGKTYGPFGRKGQVLDIAVDSRLFSP